MNVPGNREAMQEAMQEAFIARMVAPAGRRMAPHVHTRGKEAIRIYNRSTVKRLHGLRTGDRHAGSAAIAPVRRGLEMCVNERSP